MGYVVIQQNKQKNRQTILQKLSLHSPQASSSKYLTPWNKYSFDRQSARLFEDKHEAELFATRYKGLVLQEHQHRHGNSLAVRILIMLALFAGGILVSILALVSAEQESFLIGRYHILGVALVVGGVVMLRNLITQYWQE